MATLVPIPTTRVSTSFVRQRLLAQLQGDQLDVFRLQNQISTGRRISRPSEDAPAAQRAITLQRLIERKTQLSSNVDAGKSFLAATDRALTDVATALGNIRGVALGAAGTTATDDERAEARAEVEQTINQLLSVANTRFRGRYLFAGSQTNVEPYARIGNAVKYSGNEKFVQNFSDLDVLFATNAPGANVFGGISDEVISGVDLKPQLSADTLLSSLRGGRGVSPNGALQISDGTSSVVVDVSGAVTIGDVIRLIEENPPAGRTVSASISATGGNKGRGLTLQLDSSGGGNLTVKEVGSGKAASELGILNETGALTNPLVGGDVDPALLKTVRVDSLLGTKAHARLISAGSNNDLLIEAAVNGAELPPPPGGLPLNGVTVQFVSDASPGAEAADFAAGTLTIHIAAGASTANAVANAINAEGHFTARIDPTDTSNPAQAGAAAVSATATAVTDGGSGTTLDLPSGIRVQNGGQSHTLDFSNAKTVEDILNVFNGSDAGLYAAINADRTGIDVRSLLSGSDFQIGENGGSTATQLGLRTFTRDVRLNDLNYGVGVPTNNDDELTITSSQLALTTRSGASFNVDLSAAATVADVISAINAATGSSVTAQPADGGSGMRLIDHTLGPTPLTVAQSGVPVSLSGGIAAHVEAPDFTITTRSGATFNVDVSGAATIGEVIDKINAVAGPGVEAKLATVGNGLQLIDNTAGAGQLTISKVENSQAAEYLGLVPLGSTQATGTSGALTGTDQHFLEPASVFTTLTRLSDALESGDINAMQRAISQIDEDLRRATFARAEVGAREQALDLTQKNLQDEDVQLQSALSDEIDVDLVEAISNLTARQVSLQASLQTMGNILQLSLLDYL
jgi:flagellin-like hook-associated protein FlgL